jgi:hypothetical protein
MHDKQSQKVQHNSAFAFLLWGLRSTPALSRPPTRRFHIHPVDFTHRRAITPIAFLSFIPESYHQVFLLSISPPDHNG